MFASFRQLKKRVVSSSGVRRYLQNTSWLFTGQVLRLVVALLVSVALARFLGPERFGLFNYVLSVITLVSVVVALGLQNYVRPKMVQNPESREAILGTYFVLTGIASIVGYILVMLIVTHVTERSLVIGLFSILGGTLLLSPFKCLDLWFQSQVAARFSVQAASVSLLLFAVVKLVAIYLGAPLLVFALIVLCETIAVSGVQIYLYQKNYGSLRGLRVDGRHTREYLLNAWPLMLSGLAVVVYMRIDQIMIGGILGDSEVGQYAVATRISSLGHFVPQILASSLFPAIINAKSTGSTCYHQRLARYFDLNGALAYAFAVPISLGAPWIIGWLFGAEYSAAVWVLAIHAWSGIFVYLGVSRAQYLLAEGFLKFSFLCTAVGAVLNVGLNAVLIPRVGIIGAAIATVVSYAIAAFITSCLYAPVRRIGRMQLNALFIPFRPHKLKLYID